MTEGAAGLTDTGPGGPPAVGGAVTIDDPPSAPTGDAAPDPIFGMRMAYSTLGQGDDPWLRTTYVKDETAHSFFLEVVGVLASATYRGATVASDATEMPVKVAANYMPHHVSVNWDGTLDLTKNPIKTLALIPGWRLDAFSSEGRGALYFEALADVVFASFPPPAPLENLGPGVIADQSTGETFGKGASACFYGALGGIPGGPLGMGMGCLLGFDASLTNDVLVPAMVQYWNQAEPQAPDLSGLDTGPEFPDSGCFAAGTLVARPGRESVPIESIAVGDLIASREESSLNESGKRVTRTWEHPMKRTVDVRLDTGERVCTTSPHRFFTVEKGIVPAGELKVGQHLRTLAGPPRTIVGIEPGPPTVTVYNVTVEGFHTYFVGDAALWVHNEKVTQHDDPPPPPPPDPDPDPPTPEDPVPA